jgi:plastocyanin
MRYKGLVLFAALAVVAACDETTAITDNVNVGVGGAAVFSPATQTLASKKPVTFIWGGGPHNVTWEDNAPASGDKSSGTYTRDFTTAFGAYRFRCTIHSLDYSNGMVGQINVP